MLKNATMLLTMVASISYGDWDQVWPPPFMPPPPNGLGWAFPGRTLDNLPGTTKYQTSSGFRIFCPAGYGDGTGVDCVGKVVVQGPVLQNGIVLDNVFEQKWSHVQHIGDNQTKTWCHPNLLDSGWLEVFPGAVGQPRNKVKAGVYIKKVENGAATAVAALHKTVVVSGSGSGSGSGS